MTLAENLPGIKVVNAYSVLSIINCPTKCMAPVSMYRHTDISSEDMHTLYRKYILIEKYDIIVVAIFIW